MSRAILCIDDESTILTSLKGQLQSEFKDVDIELAQNAFDALEIIQELKDDNIELELIISDYLMPEMNGDEFLIKAHMISPKTKNILLTGHANIDGVTNVVNKASLYRYISKPWEKDDLLITVKEALDSFATQKELDFYTKNLERLVEEKNAQNMTYLEMIDKYLIASKTDTSGIITDVSQAMCDITGYTKEELVGKNHNIIRHPDSCSDVFKKMWTTIKGGNVWEGEIKNKKKNGDSYWVKARISPTYDLDGNIIGYASIRVDITDKVKVEDLSVTDELTGIYNRRYFNEAFKRESKRAKREEKMMGFVLLDIDYFKLFNDTYGHFKGDEALKSVASSMIKTLSRPSDFCFRLGGEEFGMLIYDTKKEDLEHIVAKVKNEIDSLEIPNEYSFSAEHLSASFGGVVFSPTSENDLETIYKKADEILYKIKKSGRNDFEIRDV